MGFLNENMELKSEFDSYNDLIIHAFITLSLADTSAIAVLLQTFCDLLY